MLKKLLNSNIMRKAKYLELKKNFIPLKNLFDTDNRWTKISAKK